MNARDVILTISRGGATFTALAMAGKVGPRSAWVGMRGAARYASAVAAGDVADDATIDARLSRCGRCTARCADPDVPEAVGWCGPPFEAATLPDGPTCGCLLEAKAAVKSETCLRGRWETQ